MKSVASVNKSTNLKQENFDKGTQRRIRQDTAKTALTDQIGLGNLLVALLTLAVVYSGYQVSSRLEQMQIQSHRYEVAETNQHFWQEIADLEKESLTLSSSLGSSAGEVVATLLEFVNELPMSFPDDAKAQEMFMIENPRLTGKWFAYIEAHGKFVSSVESIASAYDNSILKYGKVVGELGVDGWRAYVTQQPEVASWKKELLTPYREAFSIVINIVNSKKIPDGFAAEVSWVSRALGLSMVKLSAPHLKGLMEFKARNIGMLIKNT